MRTINARDAVSMLHITPPRLDYPFYKKDVDDEDNAYGSYLLFIFWKSSLVLVPVPYQPPKPLPDHINVTSHRTLLPHPPKPLDQPSQPEPPVPQPAPDEDEESAELLMQLLQLSDAQIELLQEEDRIKVRELRERLRGME